MEDEDGEGVWRGGWGDDGKDRDFKRLRREGGGMGMGWGKGGRGRYERWGEGREGKWGVGKGVRRLWR